MHPREFKFKQYRTKGIIKIPYIEGEKKIRVHAYLLTQKQSSKYPKTGTKTDPSNYRNRNENRHRYAGILVNH